MTTLIVSVGVPIFVLVVTVMVTLLMKRIERRNASEASHAEKRGEALDMILAAGDAAWYYRTQTALDPDEVDREQLDKMGHAADRLFGNGADLLLEHCRHPKNLGPIILEWVDVSMNNPSDGARVFDRTRDKIVNLKRHETGLPRHRFGFREQSFYERVMAGETVQRMPDGIQQVLHTADGGTLIQGGGEEMVQVFQDMINYPNELRESREEARIRLADWREKGVWKQPPTTDEEEAAGRTSD